MRLRPCTPPHPRDGSGSQAFLLLHPVCVARGPGESSISPDQAYPRARRAALLAAAGWVLAACAVGPDYHRPASPQASRFTEAPLPAATGGAAALSGNAQAFVEGADVPGAWWGLFRSPELTVLVTRALQNNPSLEATANTLRQAQELTIAQEGGLLPTVTGQLTRTREKISGAEAGVGATGPFAGGQSFGFYQAQLNIAYTFDVWGQVRRTIEAQAAAAAVQRFQLEAATNMLAANVVAAAVNAASLQAQIAAEQDLIAAEQRLQATVRTQFQLGAATGTDVATQDAQLANTQALVVPLQTQLAQARDQLAAYLGRTPEDAHLPDLRLADLTLPGAVPVSLPSRLVDQRPDIRAAEAQLQQATAQVGVAVANRLPQFTLTGFLGSAPARVGQLFTPGNGIYTLLTQALGPVFQGGTLLHQQRAAYDAARAAALNYRATVINGFQNVADVLTALQGDARALAANEAAQRAAARSLALAQLQFGAGGVSYLTVLTAQTQVQNAILGLIRAQAARYTDTVALYVALGGGWWNRRDLPPPPEKLLRSLLP